MKKFRLLSVIIIAAVGATVALSGCNTVLYPNIENIEEVFTKMEEIESIDCDIFIETETTIDEVYSKQNKSMCFKYINILSSHPIGHIYIIDVSQDKDIYTVGEELFIYQNGEQLPQDSTEYENNKNPSFLDVEFTQMSFVTSTPVTNRTTFTATLTEAVTSILDELGMADYAEFVSECIVVIEADNNTKMPSMIAFSIAGTTEGISYSIQYKIIFKKINKELTIDYPAEVQTYIDENVPVPEAAE